MHINGIDMEPYFRVNEIKGRGLAPQEIETITVLGRDGAYYAGKRLPSRELEVTITIIADDPESLRTKIVEINEILNVDEPVEITFPDEPQYTYFGIPAEVSEDYEFTYFHQTEFTIFCPSPYKYGVEITADFPGDYVAVENLGTADVGAVYELQVLEDTPFALIQNQYDEYMLVGNPTSVEDTTYKKFERIYYSDGDNLTGWTTANAGEVKGEIMGTMGIGGNTRFQPSSYGTSTLGWHGPAIKTSLPEAVQDFRFQSWISLYNTASPDLLGKVELYLLDVNGNIVTRMGMMEGSARMANTYGHSYLYSGEDYKRLIYEPGDRPGNWNDFAGVVRIQRSGNSWYAYIAKTDTATGRHHARRSVFWTDYENKYMTPVSQIVVYISQYKSYDTPNTLGVYSLSVDKINQPTDDEIDLALHQDDILTLDHEQEVVLVNGEPRNDLVAFGSDFFKLHKGSNELFVYPNSTFTTKATYRELFR